MAKFIRLFIFIIAVSIVISGCLSDKEKTILRIAYPNEKMFYEFYGDIWERKYPNITIDIIDSQELHEVDIKTIDIFYFNQLEKYKESLANKELYSLDLLLEKENLDKISPVVLSILRSEDGSLYGLSPFFESHGLYYNKNLFSSYNIPYPQDNMSWEEIIHLAEQFPLADENNRPVYGLITNYYVDIPFALIARVGRSEGLSFINKDDYQITINTPDWIDVWKTVIHGFKSGHIFDNGNKDFANRTTDIPIFQDDQVAMAISNQSIAVSLSNIKEKPEGVMIDWGMVTIPIDSSKKNNYGEYYVFEIYSISNNSDMKKEAWKFLDFLQSNEVTIQSQSKQIFMNKGIRSINNDIKKIHGVDFSPLYKLEYNQQISDPFYYMPNNVLIAFFGVAQQEVDAVISGEKTIEKALEDLQIRGQQAVNEARMKTGY